MSHTPKFSLSFFITITLLTLLATLLLGLRFIY